VVELFEARRPKEAVITEIDGQAKYGDVRGGGPSGDALGEDRGDGGHRTDLEGR
jgi:hypothetical protein